ncbi:MAG: hypothetical protein F4Y65_00890 [Gammaproteobacteria bacterium]|nr:hypothetical protein [Gammaproteobacteria bacterium]
MIQFVNLGSLCLRLILSGGVLVLILISTNLYAVELPFPGETIPVGDPEPPPDPPDEGVFIEYDRCTIDYTKLVLGLGSAIDRIYNNLKEEYGEEKLGHLFGPEHHDVFLNPPVVPPEGNLEERRTEKQYIARGFYGPNEPNKILKNARKWLEDDEIIYVEGSMIDKIRNRNKCRVFGSGESRDVANNSSSVVFRYQVEWVNFHLILQNCQHWAYMTLTGCDLNRVKNPEGYSLCP